MIEPTFDMIFRALFVLGIVHIALFIIDAIKLMTTYKNMNRPYYWKHESAIGVLFYIDIILCAIVCGALVIKYILTGEII
jgi:tryptophan-rich sensory protein